MSKHDTQITRNWTKHDVQMIQQWSKNNPRKVPIMIQKRFEDDPKWSENEMKRNNQTNKAFFFEQTIFDVRKCYENWIRNQSSYVA